jgi:hypothetical protein
LHLFCRPALHKGSVPFRQPACSGSASLDGARPLAATLAQGSQADSSEGEEEDEGEEVSSPTIPALRGSTFSLPLGRGRGLGLIPSLPLPGKAQPLAPPAGPQSVAPAPQAVPRLAIGQAARSTLHSRTASAEFLVGAEPLLAGTLGAERSAGAGWLPQVGWAPGCSCLELGSRVQLLELPPARRAGCGRTCATRRWQRSSNRTRAASPRSCRWAAAAREPGPRSAASRGRPLQASLSTAQSSAAQHITAQRAPVGAYLHSTFRVP